MKKIADKYDVEIAQPLKGTLPIISVTNVTMQLGIIFTTEGMEQAADDLLAGVICY